MGKRGQAAIEFLMTYGWALLVVLVSVSALSFFGVLDSGKFLPDSCHLGPGLACKDFRVVSDQHDRGEIYLDVINGMGKNLNFFAVEIVKKDDDDNQVGGGYFGIITDDIFGDNKCTPTSKCKHIFVDGGIERVRSVIRPGLGALDLWDHIRCVGNLEMYSCCKFFNEKVSNTINDFYINPIEVSDCDLLNCNNPLENDKYKFIKGNRFKAELKIIYKTQNSNIIHERIGSLITKVE